MELLEREGVVHAIEGLLQEITVDRGGRLALLSGEAGAGKSSVVAEVVERASRTGPNDVRTMEGACDPLSSPRPMGPFRDILRAAGAGTDAGPNVGVDVDLDLDVDVAELSALLDQGDDAVKGYEQLLDWLRRTAGPRLMVIEDLHWADAASLDAVRFLARRPEGTGTLLLCTLRAEEMSAALTGLLGELSTTPTVHRFELAPLSIDAVSRLSGLTGSEAAELHRSTGGNAFYVTEVVASGRQIPSSVRDAVLARVGRLDDLGRSVVELVAVVPGRIELDLLLALLAGRGPVSPAESAGPDDVDRAVASGVLVADGLHIRFRHELARAAVESSLPPARRLDLHRSVLAELSAISHDGAPIDEVRLAHHAIACGDAEAIVRHGSAAADDAARRGAHRQVVALLDHVLGAVEPGPDGPEAGLRRRLAGSLYMADDFDRSEAEADQAHQLHSAAARQVEAIEALTFRSSPQWMAGRPADARRTLDTVLDVVTNRTEDRPEFDRVAAKAHLSSAHTHMLARLHRPAKHDLAEARRLLTRTPDPEAELRARIQEAAVEVATGDVDAGLPQLFRLREEISSNDDNRRLRSILDALGSGAAERRRYSVAIPSLLEAAATAESRDEDSWGAYWRAWLVRVAFEQGRWDDVSLLVKEMRPRAGGWVGIVRLTAEGALGRTKVRRGESGGVDVLRSVVESHDGHELQQLWPPRCGLAEAAWLSGRPEEIPVLLGELYRRALDCDSEWARGEVGFWMWRAGVIDGPPSQAASPFALQMAGRWREAADEWAELGCPYEQAMALADGDQEARLAGLHLLDGLGAEPAAVRLRADLRRGGVSGIPRGPIGSTRANPAGLTRRQLEVLGLMTAGLDNGEIAAELFVTKKTVEHHVSAVLSKLGVRSRARAVAAARELGIAARSPKT